MSPFVRLMCMGLGLWLLCLPPAYAQEEPTKKPWTGEWADGRVITKADLDKILQDHNLWLERGKKGEGRAKLSGANLSEAELSEANLSDAELRGANLNGANLDVANLNGANLFEANLNEANLYGADLRGAYLSGTHLSDAHLNEAKLESADLSGAKLFRANLSGAILVETNLSGTYLTEATLSRVRFEPQPGLPVVASLQKIKGLDSLIFYGTSSYSMVELREIYKKSGMRAEERQVTFSINHTRRENLWAGWVIKDLEQQWEEMGFLSKLESLFHLVFFEWTCDYGMSPGRPLQIMGLGLLLFIFPYLLALRSRDPETGIWLLLPEDRVLDRKLKGRPFKLSNMPVGWSWPKTDWAWFKANISLDMRALRLAFYFSLLSAFHIGWRELNVGSWIARLQRKEYNLRATGWVRTVSGFQSLLSVYMLALWALSYFGRPFE